VVTGKRSMRYLFTPGGSFKRTFLRVNYNLSGSSGSPRTGTGGAGVLDPLDAIHTWLLGATESGGESIVKGEMQDAANSTAESPSYVSDNPSTDFISPKSAFDTTLWCRATNNTGSNPTGGSGLGTWLTLVPGGSDRLWSWTRTTIGTTSGSIKVDIATDSGGSNIVATGYYAGSAEVINPI